MFSGRRKFGQKKLPSLLAGLSVLLLCSCKLGTIVKKYPPNKPFVYETNIKIEGNYSKDDKDLMIAGLQNQLDDSVQSRKLDKLFWAVLKNPAVFDSSSADKSLIFMRYFLNSLGYFRDSIYYTTTVKAAGKDQLRTYIDFIVKPGKLVRLDSVGYDIKDTALQNLAMAHKNLALIKKGDPFAQAPISAEFDRITELYRNNGYLRFSRDELYGLWDTLDISLLQPTLDPFEQLEVLQKLRARRENPTANLEVRLRPITDSSKLWQYYVGNVTVYPDYSIDTVGINRNETIVKGVRILQPGHEFKPKIFPPNIYLKQGELYNQRRYLRTLNRFNALGTWRIVSVDQVPRKGQDTVDLVIRLTPAKKFAFSTNLEGSVNQSAISGNLVGFGVNVGVQNRNFAHAANQANTNVRYDIELGADDGRQFIQTQRVGFSHSITIPRLLFPEFPFIRRWKDNFRGNMSSVLSFNAANTERRFLFNQTTFNGSWGYQFQRRKWLLNVKIPNIEYSYLKQRDSLQKLIVANPSLKNIFTDGFVASVAGNFTLTGGSGRVLNVFRANIEESGALTGMIRNAFLDTHLYRFVKVDVEFARLIKFAKSSIALRGFAGLGYEFNSTRNPDKRNNLPFFKQYFSGGPNSMRAWQLRRLGPGSTIKEFSGVGSTPDRYGDVQLEANAEYRFPLGKPLGIPINGALFTDIGNVWFLKKAAGSAEERFSIGRLGKDIAIGAGAGVRIDFSFFVIRLDYAYKVKDPSPDLANTKYQNKFFAYPFFKGDQFQLGIGYPFIF